MMRISWIMRVAMMSSVASSDALQICTLTGADAAVRAGLPITAHDLAAADVVLTTFDVLSHDVKCVLPDGSYACALRPLPFASYI